MFNRFGFGGNSSQKKGYIEDPFGDNEDESQQILQQNN